MRTHYVALVRKDADSDYSVSFPDFPGVISAGATFDEACTNAVETLALYLRGLAEGRTVAPEVSSMEAARAAPDSRGAVPILVPAPVDYLEDADDVAIFDQRMAELKNGDG